MTKFYNIFSNNQKIGSIKQIEIQRSLYKNLTFKKVSINSIERYSLANVVFTSRRIENFWLKDDQVKFIRTEFFNESDGKKSLQYCICRCEDSYIDYKSIKGNLIVVNKHLIIKEKPVFIADPNFMFLNKLQLKSGERAEVSLFDFHVNRIISAQIYFKSLKTHISKSIEREYVLTFSGVKMFLRFIDNDIVETVLKDGSQEYVVTRGKHPATTKKISTVDLTNRIIKKVRREIENPYAVTKLRIFAELKLKGDLNDISFEREKLKSQSFQGVLDNKSGNVKGRFFVSHDSKGDSAKAIESPREILGIYLMPETNIEANHRGIAREARKIVRGKNNLDDKGLALLTWVNRRIKYKIFSPSAIDTLNYLESDCGGKANLLTAFFRSLHIPARTVGGLVYLNGAFGQHYWVEFYNSSNKVWHSADPTLGEYKFTNATHIKLFNGCACGVEICSIRILGTSQLDGKLFLKKPEIFDKDNNWITYRFYLKGKYVGINDNVFNRSTSSYTINSSFRAKGRLCNTILTLNDRFNPISYSKNSDNGNENFLCFGDHIKVCDLLKCKNFILNFKSESQFVLDSNVIGHYALLVASLNMPQKHRIYNLLINIFQPTLKKVFKIHLNLLKENVKIHLYGGRHIPCRKIQVMGEVVYVNNQGLVVLLENNNGLLIKYSEN